MANFRERAANSVDHIFSLYVDYLQFLVISRFGGVLVADCPSYWSLHTCYFYTGCNVG